jgi:hypothetical protein
MPSSHGTLACAALVGTLAVSTLAQAPASKVGFPENYDRGVLYWVQDRPQNRQVREYYTSPAAIEAARAGVPLPSGTVITVVQYAAQLDAQGNPATTANGRFIKGELRGYAAMEKRTGWGAEYSEDIRNGDWAYQAFTVDRTPNANADLNTCFTCHKGQDQQDYVFSYQNLKGFRP